MLKNKWNFESCAPRLLLCTKNGQLSVKAEMPIAIPDFLKTSDTPSIFYIIN